MEHRVTCVMMRRWDPGACAYQPWTEPADRMPVLSCDDGDADIWCARCHRSVQYGATYTSLQIHSSGGFGYAVCPECHDAEILEEEAGGGYGQ